MKKTKLTPRRAADNLFTYLALIVMSVIFLFPCLWLILASLSKTGSLYDFKGFFPQEYSFQTFIDLFTDGSSTPCMLPPVVPSLARSLFC